MAIRYLSGINVDSNTLFVDDANNRVGIGTASPTTSLDVVASSTTSVDIAHFANSNQVAKVLIKLDGVGSSAISMLDAGNNEDILLSTQGNSWFNAGNVGIGTTIPGQKLEINQGGTGNGEIVRMRYNASYYTDYGSNQINFTGTNQIFSFKNNGTDVVRLAANGNVGIGTTSPTAKLVVQGAAGNLYIDDLGAGYNYYDASNVHNFRNTAGISRLYINTATGNVGIGTTSPSTRLHTIVDFSVSTTDYVNGTTGSRLLLKTFASTGNTYSLIQAQDVGGTSNNALVLQPYGDNVGIGTAAPDQKLHVVGNAKVTGVFYTDYVQTLSGTSIDFRHQDASTIMRVDTANARVGIGTTSPAGKLDIRQAQSTTAFAYPFLKLYPSATTNVTGLTTITLGTSPVDSYGVSLSGWRYGTDGDPKFIIKMHYGTANGLDALTINSSGNVGIGTTSPTNKLDIRPTTSGGSDVIGTGAITVGSDNPYWTLRGTATSLQDLAFDRSYSGTWYEAMRIQRSTGNVGIGTTNPFQKLQVDGSIYSNGGNLYVNGGKALIAVGDLAFQTNNGTSYAEVMRMTGAGNVGIGTTSPGYKLDVNGESRVQGQFRITGNNIVGGYTDITGVIYHRNDLTSLNKAGTGWVGWAIRNTSGSETVTDLQNIGTFSASGAVTLSNYGAGYLKSDASGNITVDADIIEDTLDSVTDRGNTTTNNITVGNLTANGNITTNTGIFYSGNAAKLDLNQYNAGYLRLLTDNTERVRITATGNVGIGTTSPTYKLDVNGEARFGGNVNIYKTSPKLTVEASDANQASIDVKNTSLYARWILDADDLFRVYNQTSAFDAFAVKSSGNVGIGTNSPASKLHVVGDARIEGNLTINGTVTQIDTDTLTTEQWLVTNDGTGPAVVINQKGSQPVIDIQDDGTSVMYIEDGGNVGIGTTSPGTRLHVSKTDLSNELVAVRVQNDTNYSEFGTQSGYARILSGGYLLYAGSSNSTYFYNGGNVVMTTNYLGNVGIGDTTPSYRLDVSGDARVTSHLYSNASMRAPIFYDIDDTNYYVNPAGATSAILAGNVGIGTNSPYGKLDVIGDSSSHVARFSNLTTTGYAPGSILLEAGQSDSRGQGVYHYNPVADESWFTGVPYAVGSRKWIVANKLDSVWNPDVAQLSYAMMTIDSDTGNVGIGTTSPTATLDVAGEIAIRGGESADDARMYFRASDNSNRFTIETDLDGTTSNDLLTFRAANADDILVLKGNGNVGIGTSSPNAILAIKSGSNSDLEFFSEASGTALQSYNRTSSAWGYLRFLAGGGEQMRIHTNGNVGIGTTSPAAKLHVHETTAGIGGVLVGNASNSNSAYSAVTLKSDYPHSYYPGLFLNSSTNTAYAGVDQLMLYQFHSKPIALVTNNTVRLTVTGSGDVGIGTTSPVEKLSVNGNINSNKVLAGTTANLAYSEGTGGTNGQIYLNPLRGNRTLSITTQQSAAGDDIDGTTISTFYTNTGNPVDLLFKNGSTNTMILKSTGNVGIGTTSPTAALHVQKSISGGFAGTVYNTQSTGGFGLSVRGGNSSSEDALRVQNVGGSYLLNVKGDGNVGIGTTAPSVQLDIEDSGNVIVDLNTTTANANTTVRFQESGTVKATMGYEGTSDVVLIANGGFTAGNGINIDASNNVGIGTASPTSPLHVVSSTNKTLLLDYTGGSGSYTWASFKQSGTEQFRIWGDYSNNYLSFYNDQTSSHQLTLASNAYVGIGTSNPQKPLHVISANDAPIRVESTDPTTGILFVDSDSSNALYYVGSGDYFYTSSKLGIGTTSPAAKLDVSTTGTVQTAILGRGSDTNFRLISRQDVTANTSGAVIGEFGLDHTTTRNAAIRFHRGGSSTGGFITLTANDGTERVRIASDGKVGIGTTSPNHRVDIYSNENVPLRIHRPSNANLDSSGAWGIGFSTRGDANTSTTDTRAGIFSYYNGNLFLAAANTSIVADPDAYARLTILNTGYVGIGTTSPSQELHVSGNLRVTGAYYDSNNSAGTSGQILKSTGTGTDWVTLSEITGVDGTGTANYIAKWSDTDTIANSQIQDNGTTVGIGQAPGSAKLSVAGNSIEAGGKVTYKKSYSSGVDTTGVAVAGLPSSSNGNSTLLEFTCSGGAGHYQKIVYSCWNAATVWYTKKVVDEGTNAFDVEASADAATITFTFKSRSGLQQYTPKIVVEANGTYDTSYL